MQTAQATAFKVYTNDDQSVTVKGDQPGDRDLASGVTHALHILQEALDAATLAGLIVEPNFKRYPNRFRDRGSDIESYVAAIQIYRKLA